MKVFKVRIRNLGGGEPDFLHFIEIVPPKPTSEESLGKLAKVSEITLENRPTVGVMISNKDQADMRLYFDKETFSLVKLVHQVANSTTTYEEYFDDYIQLDELVYPRKSVVFIRGTKQHEKEITALKFIEPPADDYFDQS